MGVGLKGREFTVLKELKIQTRTLKCYNIFSHWICFDLFRNIHNNHKKQNAKVCPCPDSKPGPLSGSETKAATFLERGLLFRPEVIVQSCWFSIPNNKIFNFVLCAILKQIRQKLQPWECHNMLVQNCRYDVIEFKTSKIAKMTLANILKIICGKFY